MGVSVKKRSLFKTKQNLKQIFFLLQATNNKVSIKGGNEFYFQKVYFFKEQVDVWLRW